MTSPPPARRRATWDIALSIIFLIGNAVVFVGGAFISVFVMAFTDYCPPGCDIDAGVNAVFAVGTGLAVVGLAATVVTIVLLARRRRAWWLPLATGLLTLIGWVVAFALYTDAVSPL